MIVFKPKNQKVYVPGHGVIERENFDATHLDACLKQIKAAKLDKEAYLKKRFDIVSFGDLPLFGEGEQSEGDSADPAAKAQEEAEKLAADEAARKQKELDDFQKELEKLEADEAAKKAAADEAAKAAAQPTPESQPGA